jgi:hypothetical protein
MKRISERLASARSPTPSSLYRLARELASVVNQLQKARGSAELPRIARKTFGFTYDC